MIHWLFNYYNANNVERQEELDFCLIENYNNKHIDKIHIFGTIDKNISDMDYLNKITIIDKERPTFKDYINYSVNNISHTDIVILSNSDIYFDDTLNILPEIDFDKCALALSRYVLQNNTIFLYPEPDICQDTWIYKPDNRLLDMDCDFYMGVNGCDNRIAFEFAKVGLGIINPSHDIKTYHKHKTHIHRENPEWLMGRCMKVPAIKLIDLY